MTASSLRSEGDTRVRPVGCEGDATRVLSVFFGEDPLSRSQEPAQPPDALNSDASPAEQAVDAKRVEAEPVEAEGRLEELEKPDAEDIVDGEKLVDAPLTGEGDSAVDGSALQAEDAPNASADSQSQLPSEAPAVKAFEEEPRWRRWPLPLRLPVLVVASVLAILRAWLQWCCGWLWRRWVDHKRHVIRSDWQELEFAPMELRCEYETVMAAVRQNWRALEFASEALRSERAIVEKAVVQSWRALRFASRSLRADRELMLGAVRRSNGWALEFASEELYKDADLVHEATRRLGGRLGLPLSPIATLVPVEAELEAVQSGLAEGAVENEELPNQPEDGDVGLESPEEVDDADGAIADPVPAPSIIASVGRVPPGSSMEEEGLLASLPVPQESLLEEEVSAPRSGEDVSEERLAEPIAADERDLASPPNASAPEEGIGAPVAANGSDVASVDAASLAVASAVSAEDSADMASVPSDDADGAALPSVEACEEVEEARE